MKKVGTHRTASQPLLPGPRWIVPEIECLSAEVHPFGKVSWEVASASALYAVATSIPDTCFPNSFPSLFPEEPDDGVGRGAS